MQARDYLLNHIPKKTVGAEIGVHTGDFSLKILNTTNPKHLYLIDPWKSFTENAYSQSWYGSSTTQSNMDQRFNIVKNKTAKYDNVSIIRKLSYEASNDFEDNSLEWIYIDGDHTFEGVCKDFESFYPKIKPKGYIYGDDYSLGNWWGSGVVDALHKNLYEKNLKLIFLQNEQFCVQKVD